MKLSHRGRLVTAVAALVAAVSAPSAGSAAHRVIGEDFPDALLACTQLAALGLSTLVLLVVLAAAARLSLPGVPLALRCLLFAGVAVSVATAPAHADRSHDLRGLPLPDRPVSSAPMATPVAAPVDDTVTVRAGDTVWGIAAAHLPAGATDAQTAASVEAWHGANRDLIGPDPDLIHPGQVLVPPTPHPAEDS